MRAQLTDPRDAFNYIMAGRGRFTIVSVSTGNRFTYRIGLPSYNPGHRKPKIIPRFVSVLISGSDDYAFIGFIRGTQFLYSQKAKVSEDAPSFKAFAWFFRRLTYNIMPEDAEFWHEGKCALCGRALTVPESIARGFGPICLEKM